jgi:DNA-binding FadR family transcriptional regulator
MLPVRGRMEDALEEHRAIAAAVDSKRIEKAEAAMRKHLDRVDHEFRSFAAANPKLVRRGKVAICLVTSLTSRNVNSL